MEILRAVIHCRWQPKTVIYQNKFTASVAAVHPAYLGHCLVTFIDDANRILGKIIKEAKGSSTRSSPVKKTGIVFDAIAIT